MNKKYIAIFIIIIILFLLFAFLGFYYHDDIEKIIDGDNWSYIDSYTELDSTQSLICFGRNNLCVCTKEGFKVYNNTAVTEKKDITITDYLYDSDGIYSALYVTDTKTIYLIKNDEIILNKTLDISPKSIYVSKSGYVVVLYSQIGYKTGIRVYKHDGEETLTTYLANSYATCAKISNDDKYLFVGEVDSSGIKVKSKIKEIELDSKKTEDIDLPLGGIIVDIQSHNNELLVKTDIGIYKVNSSTKEMELLIDYNINSAINAYINVNNEAILIKDNDEPYLNDYEIVFYKNDVKQSVPFNSFPQDIDIYENIVALNFGNEVWIIRNGHLKNKIIINEALTGMNIFSDGKELALMFRDSIKIVKI